VQWASHKIARSYRSRLTEGVYKGVKDSGNDDVTCFATEMCALICVCVCVSANTSMIHIHKHAYASASCCRTHSSTEWRADLTFPSLLLFKPNPFSKGLLQFLLTGPSSGCSTGFKQNDFATWTKQATRHKVSHHGTLDVFCRCEFEGEKIPLHF
jgi:hypothetical protein